jgi:hypothetical protein
VVDPLSGHNILFGFSSQNKLNVTTAAAMANDSYKLKRPWPVTWKLLLDDKD